MINSVLLDTITLGWITERGIDFDLWMDTVNFDEPELFGLDFEGSYISRADGNPIHGTTIRITYETRFQNGGKEACYVILDNDIPTSVLIGCEGKPLQQIIDCNLFEGCTIKSTFRWEERIYFRIDVPVKEIAVEKEDS